MDADRWQRLSPLLDALLELGADARAQHLSALRGEDPALAADLDGLLALEDEGDDFLSEPLIPPIPGPRAGSAVGPYQLDRMLGEGGMGQVWLAVRNDGLYQRRVALKLLRPGLADPNLRLRFTRERQILARLEHPHIARLLDAGISGDSQPYLALEYVDGEPLTDWCRAHGASVDACLRLFLQVCEAVSHAHANLIVHRDLKPSNILVTPLDEVRLLDFGIAKLLDTPDQATDNTRTGLRTFTLHYAAPEQIRGEPVTTMTDVYSLGVVLYELLSGHKPYRLKRNSDAEWEEAILSHDPLRPSAAAVRMDEAANVVARAPGSADTASARRMARDAVSGSDVEHDRSAHAAASVTPTPRAARRRARQISGDLDNIVLKALAKRPELRYASVEALALDLQRYRDGKPVHARPRSVLYRLGKYVHRQRWALATAALVGLMLASTLGIIAWQTRQSVREGARAQALQDFVVGLFENAGSAPAGAPLDVRQLLDAGVQRGDRELAQQPVARAELFGVIARLRVGLGDYDQALALLQRQRAIVERLGGEAPDSLRLESITDLGRTLRMLGRNEDCVTLMRPLQPIARREERPLPAQASEYYTQLGRCQRGTGQRDAARALFERSMGLREDLPNAAAGIVDNLADLAGLRADDGDSTGAERALRAALRELEDKVGPRQPLAIEILRQLCALQREHGDARGAERDCRAGLALSLDLVGTQNRQTIDARRQLAALLVDQGRFAEAQVEFADAHAWMLSHLGLQNPDVARNDNSLGIVAWELGDIDTALDHLRRAITTARATQSPLLSGLLFNRAMILHSVGRDAEARPLLEEALVRRREATGTRTGAVGATLRLLGEVDAALGHDARAHLQLRQAAADTAAGFGNDDARTQRSALSLARFEAARGDGAAMARLRRLGTLPEGDVELRKVAWRAQAYAAALDCRGPRRAQARAVFGALDLRLRAMHPEGGELVREVTALRAACEADAVRRAAQQQLRGVRDSRAPLSPPVEEPASPPPSSPGAPDETVASPTATTAMAAPAAALLSPTTAAAMPAPARSGRRPARSS